MRTSVDLILIKTIPLQNPHLSRKEKIKLSPICVDDIFSIIDHNGKGLLVDNSSKVKDMNPAK